MVYPCVKTLLLCSRQPLTTFHSSQGGWIRPKLVEELTDTLEDVKAGKSRWSTAPTTHDHRSMRPGEPKIQASPKSYIGPGPDYIAPASTFFFPGANSSTSLFDYLPSKNAADSLISQYWAAVHYMARIVRAETLKRTRTAIAKC